MSNHLGNVLSVVSDKKIPNFTASSLNYFNADVKSYSDYYPFGMLLPGRHGNSGNYRYGFNGMELDNDVKGEGNSYTSYWRQYDPRVARWLSLDPEMASLAHQSPYVGFDNNPITNADPNGNCTDCDKHKNPNGSTIETPKGTSVWKDIMGNVTSVLLETGTADGSYFWDSEKSGYYNVSGELYKNPDASWYDGALNSVGDLWNQATDLDTYKNGLITMMNQSVEHNLKMASANPMLNDDTKQDLLEMETPYLDASNASTNAMIAGMPDWGWQQWSGVGANVGVTYATGKVLGRFGTFNLPNQKFAGISFGRTHLGFGYGNIRGISLRYTTKSGRMFGLDYHNFERGGAKFSHGHYMQKSVSSVSAHYNMRSLAKQIGYKGVFRLLRGSISRKGGTGLEINIRQGLNSNRFEPSSKLDK